MPVRAPARGEPGGPRPPRNSAEPARTGRCRSARRLGGNLGGRGPPGTVLSRPGPADAGPRAGSGGIWRAEAPQEQCSPWRRRMKKTAVGAALAAVALSLSLGIARADDKAKRPDKAKEGE